MDNGSGASIQKSLQILSAAGKFDILALDTNSGVATAQNKGIAWAKEHRCSHVLFFDQDSVPSPGMVEHLLFALNHPAHSNRLIAAVGPRLVDRRTGASTPFVQFSVLGVIEKTYQKSDPGQLIETDFLVSSGMLIPLEILDKVGLPEEELFIDNVDLEWCFRARNMGLSVYGVNNAFMEHSVGDQVIKLGGHVIHLHNPSRQYYIMRNRILLYQRSYSPWGWIIQDFARMLFKLLAFSIFFGPRIQNLAMMIKGIKDGLIGKMGKLR